MYISIGNIAKAVCRQPSKRGTILLAYIPVAKLECLSPKDVQGRAYRLFHYCMTHILKPLVQPGHHGVKMTCADNHIRLIFPILASYIANYSEQCLIAANKENACPICEVAPDQRGEPLAAQPRSPGKVLQALRTCTTTPSQAYKQLSLRPIMQPFWADLPHTNIFQCFTPDLLHQLHKGVFKDHLVKWCTQIAGDKEIDERFKCMPNHPSLRHFKRGISAVSQWTGREFKEMERVFASLVLGAVPPDAAVVARVLIDFIYYASFPSHSPETLRRLQDSLDSFHEHKHIFIQHGIRTHFRIPKIHMMEHYVEFIRAKGAADGYNTEISERLHINYAKEGYRASNKKDFTKQMVAYLNRHEAIQSFQVFLTWAAGPSTNDVDTTPSDPDSLSPIPAISMHVASSGWQIARHAPFPQVPLQFLIDKHGCYDIVTAVATYLHQNIPTCEVTPTNADLVDVYKRISMSLPSPQQLTEDTQQDVIRATPSIPSSQTKPGEPEHFDTVLVHDSPDAEDIGLTGV